MLTMAASIDVVSDSDSELVARAASAYAGILRSSREVLTQQFELGRLVTTHLQRHQRAHTAVVDLARRISSSCGKAILPQRLYEAARFYATFGGVLDRVWAFERQLVEPLTYTYLIRAIIRCAVTPPFRAGIYGAVLVWRFMLFDILANDANRRTATKSGNVGRRPQNPFPISLSNGFVAFP